MDHAGKKVLIVGACTSAHDIATDYYNNGIGKFKYLYPLLCIDTEHVIDVTMFQRSSTYIMSTEKGWPTLFQSSSVWSPKHCCTYIHKPLATYWEGGPPVDVADRINASWPHHNAVGLHQRMAGHVAHLDKDLLESLHKVGFRTNLGLKDSGFGLLAWSKAGGYYLGEIIFSSENDLNSILMDLKIRVPVD